MTTEQQDGLDPVAYGEGHRTLGMVRLDNLYEHPKNPKAHDLETIDSSVGRFGYVEPVVVDERTGYLISGHGRRATLLAMRERGEAAPEGVQEDADGMWRVPVVRGWRSRTDSEATAALIAMNRTTELGGWVDDELLELLDNLAQEEGDGLAGVGFDGQGIEALRARLEAEALVDGFNADGPDGDLDSDDLDDDFLGEVEVTGDTTEIVVVIPSDRYEDFYALMHETEWVKDVRDKGK